MRQVIIDADVASHASNKPGLSKKTIAQMNIDTRAFLDALHNETKDVMVMYPELLHEWRFASKFSTAWRAQMVSERREKMIANPPITEFRSLIANAGLNANEHQTAIDDLHLVEAAIKTGKIVISNERKSRNVLNKAASNVKVLKEIEWVSPRLKSDRPFEWIQGKHDPIRYLGA
jgi:hypothetical protein